MEAPEVLRRRILQLLEAHDLPRDRFAERIGRDESWVSKVLAKPKPGKPAPKRKPIKPTIEVLDAIASAFKVSVPSLFDEEALRLHTAKSSAPETHTDPPRISVTNGLEKHTTSADNASRTQDINPRESREMADREQDDPLRRAVLGAYESLGTFPPGVRERMQRRFADGVNQILGELLSPPVARKKSKNHRG